MHVAVLGAGVTGVTTAYFLARLGCDVTVIDGANGPAAGATQANGGQLSYSFTDALARPAFLPGIPGLLAGRDPAVRIRLLARPSLLGWGLRFLRQCTAARARANTLHVLALALRSARCLADVRERTGVGFAYRESGKLVLLPTADDMRRARATADLKARHGCETRVLSVDEACDLEPALGPLRDRFSAAVYSGNDAVGDARAYTTALADWLQEAHGSRFRFGEPVEAIITEAASVKAVRTAGGNIEADAVVVCLGTGSPEVLRTAGIRAHIYPVRGYSVTLPRGEGSPSISFTDLKRRLLFCPLGDVMRISGFADFTGFDHRRDAERIELLHGLAKSLAPHVADFGSTERHPWAGSRPMTPDGRPLVGATRIPGLYVNCGHGMLGWTLAAATASDLADELVRRAERPAKRRGEAGA